MRKILNRVTITGADDSIKPSDLVALTKEFPFVEWGVLLSKSEMGGKRFPSSEWLQQLKPLGFQNLSGHLCGKWVRDLCVGLWSFMNDCPGFPLIFKRLQLNFHSYAHLVDTDRFITSLMAGDYQYIFQLDGTNNHILDIARQHGVDAVGLYDISGGAGIVPRDWPKADGYFGYAGGLSPENLEEQLEKISLVCGFEPVWIDTETRVRSNNDLQFDLEKVHAFLSIAKSWVIE